MKKILLVLVMLCALQLSAQTPHYGYAPDNFTAEEMKARGTGENAYMAGMICLDPAVDPVVKRLKGKQVKGVRCFLRAAYAQKRQKYSYIMHTTGSPDAEATKVYCNFEEGWNEIMFDQPITIGDEKLFVGLQVYELRGTPWPLVCYGKASVPGGCWINAKREGWKSYDDQGTLLIQAILEEDALPLLENTVYALASDVPLTVAPAKMFNAGVYFHNCSPEPISSVVLETQGQGDSDVHTQVVNFDTPIPAYGGCYKQMQLRSGAEPGTEQWLTLTVPTVNGEKTQEAAKGTSTLYVTEDAFTRVPLVEQFTSQRCTNCPFMIYYLDKAIEEFSAPVLYVTHHSGYQNDAFTMPIDESLLYLFGEETTSNPAVMYDRCVPVGDNNPVIGANKASTEPYTNALQAALIRPAMAEVIVDLDESDGKVACRVHGRINREMASSKEPLYLSVYLVEDSITLENNPQLGLDGEGAPADIMERFRHNGIKRHIFNKEHLGDLLTLDENYAYSVDFEAIEINKAWNWKNCHVVAFVHKVDQKDMKNNEVLNAGSSKFNGVVDGIDAVRNNNQADVRFAIGANGALQANMPVKNLQVYDMAGKQINTRGLLRSGAYVLRYTLPNGMQGSQKLMVK